MSQAPAEPVRLSGTRFGEERAWTEGRVEAWLGLFLGLGVVARLVRFAATYPLWRDEGFLAANLTDRDFAGLLRPLDYQQVCPLLFLWAEKGISLLFGFNERSLRLLPTLASIAGLVLFRHVAGRLIRGFGLVVAVGILAVAYPAILHGGEVKPYATDFLVSLGLTALAVEWLQAPGRTGFLWALAALGPLAVGLSNPSIFVIAGVGLGLAVPVLRTRSPRAIAAWLVFGLASGTTFLILLRSVNASQGESVMEWMRIYWAGAFPPRSPGALAVWLARVHTSQMFGYPAGGDVGASSLTTGLVVAALVAYLRRGSRTLLLILLAPFGFGMAAAFLGRYPYGGSARTMQYVAPAIVAMAGLGAAVLVGRVSGPWTRRIATWSILGGLVGIGLGSLGWDALHPYKTVLDQQSRDFARGIWTEESAGAELVCARTDLRLPLDRLFWQGDRAAMYLCHQAIYSERHRRKAPPRLDGSIRLVVFGEVPGDRATVAAWSRDRYILTSRRVRVLNEGLRRGKAKAEDRYVLYDFVPVQPIKPSPAASRSTWMLTEPTTELAP